MSISNILQENGANKWNLECATMKVGTGPTVITSTGDIQFDDTATGTSKYNILAGGGGASLVSVSNSLSAGQCKIGIQTFSSSTETGAVVVNGGVGIGGDLHVGGTIYGSGINPTTPVSLSPLFTGAITGSNFDITLIKFGTIVFYTFVGSGSVSQVAPGFLSCHTGSLPFGFEPSGDRLIFGQCYDDGTKYPCWHTIKADGSIVIQPNGTAFSGNTTLIVYMLTGFYNL